MNVHGNNTSVNLSKNSLISKLEAKETIILVDVKWVKESWLLSFTTQAFLIYILYVIPFALIFFLINLFIEIDTNVFFLTAALMLGLGSLKLMSEYNWDAESQPIEYIELDISNKLLRRNSHNYGINQEVPFNQLMLVAIYFEDVEYRSYELRVGMRPILSNVTHPHDRSFGYPVYISESPYEIKQEDIQEVARAFVNATGIVYYNFSNVRC